jgi:sugar phosphate isomerase/epimerase
MKLGIAVAPADAPPTTFVVFRDDLERSIKRAADLGYDGVELALRDASQIDLRALRKCLAATGMEVPCISSGQVFAADHLYFTHPDESIRCAAVKRITGLVALAAELNAKVNLGRVRGFVHDSDTAELARARFLSCLNRCADATEPLGVELIIEPVNRYEINFLNTCAEALETIRESGRTCLKLMPDVFHMNIEEVSFRAAFEAGREYITYVHVADSNRLAPGWGHLPFDEIFQILTDIGYDGYVTAEILPKPDPVSAAEQAAGYLAAMLNRFTPARP